MQNEFDLIHFLKQQNLVVSPYLELGIGDDAAIQNFPENYSLVTSVDTSIAGVHFPLETSASDIAYKSLAVSLSDIAAMGAEPIGVLLTLTLPEINQSWLEDFACGFFGLAKNYNLPLIGGDTTRGPLSISTIVQGLVPRGQALLRSGARAGDLIYVSGCLGDAGLALQEWQAQRPVKPIVLEALNRPKPRVALGLALRDMASSAIDISDGLAQDLNHILTASQVGAEIYLENLPLSESLLEQRSLQEAQSLALNAGDDYELCFSVDPKFSGRITELAQELNLPLTFIGKVTADLALKRYDRGQLVEDIPNSGYQHF